jgi:CubicO group peptidase (beta-lactamase class C family)
MAGVHLRPPDLARLGSLHLSGGRHGGRQLLPAGWLAAQAPGRGEVGLGCFAHSVRTVDPPNRIGFGHDGYLGQWISVQPEAGIVAVRMREAEDQDLALIWEGFPADVHAAWAG